MPKRANRNPSTFAVFFVEVSEAAWAFNAAPKKNKATNKKNKVDAPLGCFFITMAPSIIHKLMMRISQGYTGNREYFEGRALRFLLGEIKKEGLEEERHSVLISSDFASRAPIIVCQARLAHLVRDG